MKFIEKFTAKLTVATAVLAASCLPALAHPGHPELAGPAGHDAAHVLIGLVLCLGVVAAIVARNAWRSTRKEE